MPQAIKATEQVLKETGELLQRWDDPEIRQGMIASAMESGGPKAVSELIDEMMKLEKQTWHKVLGSEGMGVA